MKRQLFLTAIVAFCVIISLSAIKPVYANMPIAIHQCLQPETMRVNPQKYVELATAKYNSAIYYYIQVIYRDSQPYQTLIQAKNGSCKRLTREGDYFVSLTKFLPLDVAVRLSEARWRYELKTPFGSQRVKSFSTLGSNKLDNGEQLEPVSLPREDVIALKRLGIPLSSSIKILP